MDITDAYDYTDRLRDILVAEGLIQETSKKFRDIKKNAEKVKFLELSKKIYFCPYMSIDTSISLQKAFAET